jgi:hypothetical protein
LVVNLRLLRIGRLLAAALLGGVFAAALFLSVRLLCGGGSDRSDRLAERLWRRVIVLLESADEDSDGQVLVVDELAVVFGVVQPIVGQRRVEVRVVVDREQDVVQLADRAEVVDRPVRAYMSSVRPLRAFVNTGKEHSHGAQVDARRDPNPLPVDGLRRLDQLRELGQSRQNGRHGGVGRAMR